MRVLRAPRAAAQTLVLGLSERVEVDRLPTPEGRDALGEPCDLAESVRAKEAQQLTVALHQRGERRERNREADDVGRSVRCRE